MCRKSFLSWGTIANYNPWTADPANLKSLACVVGEMYIGKIAKYTPIDCTLLLQKMQWNVLCPLQEEVRICTGYPQVLTTPIGAMGVESSNESSGECFDYKEAQGKHF